MPNPRLGFLKSFAGAFLLIGALGLSATKPSQDAPVITVDITPAHATNHFSPLRALGAGVDSQPAGAMR